MDKELQAAGPRNHNLFFGNMPVRMVMDENGVPWWVARDVCEVLELESIANVLEGLDEDELTVIKLQSGGQPREMSLISESGLFALVIRSGKSQARPFRRWLTREVLPAIRKQGSSPEGVFEEQRALSLIMERLGFLEQKLDTLRINANQYGPVWAFAHKRCETGMHLVTPKDMLYAAYVEYCKTEKNHIESKAHFFMKLYSTVGFIYSSTVTIEGRKEAVVRGIGLKDVSPSSGEPGDSAEAEEGWFPKVPRR